MRVFRRYKNPEQGFTFIELLVAMAMVSFIGGAIFVTFSQGVRIWQAAVRESAYDKEAFFLEELKSELRNAFLYGKSALNGKNQMLEFHTLVVRLSKGNKPLKVPAQIRYRFLSAQKLIQKEITFYEKMLNGKSTLYESRTALANISNFEIEYYQKSKKGSSASWVKQWASSCFPEAIKLTWDAEAARSSKETQVISIPARGECVEDEELVV